MKRLILGALICASGLALAQNSNQNDDSLQIKPVIPIEKQGLLKNVNMYMNMRFGLDNQFTDGKFQESRFNDNQVRLEIKGKIHDKVYFRFRDRYTKTTSPGSRDNLSRSTDMAYIGVDVTPTTQLNLGKMSADWGGYEFDFNPIDILEYNDILEYADNFLTGVGISQRVSPNHSFGLQVLNSRTANMDEIYKGTLPVGIEASKLPMAVIGSWRGSFFDGKFETIYSYSYFHEAKNRGMKYIALGNKFQVKNNLAVMYDFKYSREGLDRKGLVTNMLADLSEYTAQDVAYKEHWVRTEYQFAPRWNFSLTLMSSDAYSKNLTALDSGYNHLRTAYGVIPALQFSPFKNLNLKFNVSYVGRFYHYSDFAKENLGLSNYNTGRVSIGFIAPLWIL